MRVFSVFFQGKILKKAAFLLPDPKGEWFIPRLHTGLDVSSSRRLRIPSKDLESLFSTHTVKISKEIEFLEPYLSRRIFESTSGIVLVPFFHGEKITGCLVEFTDVDSPDQLTLDSFPNRDLEKIAAFLVKSRKRIGRIEENSILEPEQIMEATDHTIKQAQKEEKHLIFLIVDLSSLIDQLMNDIVYLDRFYLKKDLQATLSLLSTDSGFCGAADGDKTIIALKTKKPHSRNVIIHQINHLLQIQCYEGREIPDFNILNRIWPEDGVTAAELLSDFINGDE